MTGDLTGLALSDDPLCLLLDWDRKGLGRDCGGGGLLGDHERLDAVEELGEIAAPHAAPTRDRGLHTAPVRLGVLWFVGEEV